ncbi:MAG: flagellar motor protein MotB [Phycisphaeraceae bacterium]
MIRAKTLTTALLLAASAMLGTGCVSQGSHDDLLRINRQLEERRVELEQEVALLKQTIAQKDAQIAAMQDQSGANAALRQRLAEEQQNVAALRAQLAALRAELDNATGAEPIVIVNGLPPEVSDALRDLAAANADLMIYDEARGMIRLRSDLTFALGKADVNDAAKAALGRLAGVLNSNAASKFDIQVIGHTDAVPVRSALGKQQHIDNRGLSSNRGDAVARVLIANGVSASRVVSGGRGETQPIEPNDARGRSQANRRVEIFLVKAADNAGAAAPAPAPSRPAVDEGAPAGGGVTEGRPDPQDDSVFK